MNYYLNIGTNLGNRQQNLLRAIESLRKSLGGLRCSEVVETPAWGFVSPNAFLNVGVLVRSQLAPLDMLHLLHGIECSMGSATHRDSHGHYADRLIDIDIVAIDELVLNLPQLQVPHPHLAERTFFLRPMIQLAPQWVHPTLHLTAKRLLDRLETT